MVTELAPWGCAASFPFLPYISSNMAEKPGKSVVCVYFIQWYLAPISAMAIVIFNIRRIYGICIGLFINRTLVSCWSHGHYVWKRTLVSDWSHEHYVHSVSDNFWQIIIITGKSLLTRFILRRIWFNTNYNLQPCPPIAWLNFDLTQFFKIKCGQKYDLHPSNTCPTV